MIGLLFLYSALFFPYSIVSMRITELKKFLPNPFFPAELFAGNEHFQTIVGSEALRVRFIGDYPRNFQTRREKYVFKYRTSVDYIYF